MNFIKITGLILILLIFDGCSTKVTNNQIPIKMSSTEEVLLNVNQNTQKSEETTPNANIQTEKHSNKITETDIKNSLGLIVLSENYGENDFIRIYNQDGSLWYRFTYYYDGSDGKFEYYNEEFVVFSFHPDYFILGLRCVGEDKNYYHVIVNEETGLKKFVKKSDTNLKLESWEQYVLNSLAIEFNNEQNPLREEPGGQLISVDIKETLNFHAEEIKGEWLKVSWYDNDDREQEPKFGWVKWKKDQKIIINLIQLC